MTWPRAPIRLLASLGTGHTPSRSVPEYWIDCDVPWLTLADVGPLRTGTVKVVEQTSEKISQLGLANSAAVLHRAGTVVMSRTASVGYSAILGTDAATSQDYVTWTCSDRLNNRFLYWVLQGERQQIIQRMQGSTHKTIYMPDIEALTTPVPPVDEQRAIADYLDAETARIDALITKKQQLIHLLEERRASSFSQALDELGVAVPQRLGGNHWHQVELRSGWRVGKLSSALRQLTNGYVGPTRDILQDDGVRYIQGLHIKRGRIDFDRRPYYVSDKWHESRPRTALRPGDVLIVQTGDIGQCAVVPENFGNANCHALLIARTRETVMSGDYLACYLQGVYGRNSLLQLATGALHPHLEFGIRDAPLLIPDPAYQAQIVARVAESQETIDQLLTRSEAQLELLAERRQALITAAVTGEFKVSGAP